MKQEHGVQVIASPVKQPETKDIHDSIQYLQDFEFDVVYGGVLTSNLRDELRRLCQSAEGML
jgi:hypothetical protein